MQVFVEDWSARYGSPYLVGPDDGGATARAELVEDGPDLRTHGGDSSPASSLAFVDGVRRLEASLYLSDGEKLAHGVAGSHACGAVLVDGTDRMAFAHIRVERLAIFGAGMRATLPGIGGFLWRSTSVADDSPEAPMNELQTRMRQQEGFLAAAKRAGRLDDELERLGRIPLLIVDEVGYIPFDPEAAALFFALISSRYERRSLIVSSNKTFSAWAEIFGDPVAVAAMVDRLVHHAEVIVLKGDSFRLRGKRQEVLTGEKER